MLLFGKEKIIYEKDSIYHHIVVTEENGVRFLKFGNQIVQSAVFIDDPEKMYLEYTKCLPLGLAFKPDCRKLLHIGLGGGVVPRLIKEHLPEIQITAVEIDPDVVIVAKRHFFIGNRPLFDIAVMDGRVFLKRAKQKYDVVMLDAYNSDAIPFHLTTVEFLKEVKAKLNEGGAVVANLWSSDYQLYLSMVKTYQQVFPQICRFKVVGKNNIILVACDKKLSPYEIMQRTAIVQDKAGFNYDLVEKAKFIDNQELDLSKAKILTDDYAPVEWLQGK
jgi:spermidine synthase